MKKKYLILGLLLVALGAGYFLNQYLYKGHRDIAAELVDFELKPEDLNRLMSNAESSSDYIDKVIQIQGQITSIEQQAITLNDQVQVNFINHNINELKVASTLKIKGRCVGYDDLLELVKIDQATIINN